MYTLFSGQWRRIEYLLKYIQLPSGKSGVSLQQFVQLLGIRWDNTFYKLRQGESLISSEIAEAIHRMCPTVSVKWLINGVGDRPKAPIRTTLQILPARANPWWPDKGPGLLTGSIVGHWEYRKSLHYGATDDPKWEELPRNNDPAIPVFSKKFRKDGIVEFYDNDMKTDRMGYAFDPASGRLVIGADCLLVSKLTDTELEYIDWSDMEVCGVAKDIYGRK